MPNKINEIEQHLLVITREFLIENGNELALKDLTLDVKLTENLGIGSLERGELFKRIEASFAVQLPDSLLAEAQTLRHIVIAVQHANPPEFKSRHEFTAHLEAATLDLSKVKTLTEVLSHYATHYPNRPHIYLQDEHGSEKTIRYGELYHNAITIAQGLRERGLKPAETVAIMLPTSEEFFYSYFGVLYAGGVPVPIYPPFRPNQIEEYAKREAKILKNAEVRIMITFQKAETLGKILKNFIPSLTEVTTVDALIKSNGNLSHIIVDHDDAAMIQYTSGSTGDPKGVLLTHYNLLANIHAYGKAINVTPQDAVVSWLPLYHDMGLIGCWLGSLYYGVPLTVMSPLLFLARPERWLWAIHTHRATISAGPNFAYELCVRKISEKALEGLDLSCWRLAFNGAEAIYPNTIRDFIKRFAKYGFKAECYFPVYGLAENAVALTFPKTGRPPRIDCIQREPFERERKAVPAGKNDKNTLEFVCCGHAIPDHEIRIAGENGDVLPERQVGLIEFRGPSAMQGYYRNPQATQAIHHDGWWNTGDYAYMADGEVFITGRKKDVIIKAGRNLYPAEVEELATQVNGIRKGCVAAFGVIDSQRGTEKFIIVAETKEQDTSLQNQIIKGINEVISNALGLPPDQIVLVKPGQIPKTSSGKLRRADCKLAYIHHQLTVRKRPFWMQVTRLVVSGFGRKSSKWISKSGRFLYGVYAGIILLITTPLVWLGVAALSKKQAGKLAKLWARTLFILLGCPISITGAEHLKQTAVIASNHTSYADTPLLLAILPENTIFVGKEELLKIPLLSTFIKKMGHIMVDRLDFSKSEQEVKQIENALKNGASIVIFPEGTFTYATGLRPFKLGTFKVAAETKLPILPISIQGTRQILRSGSILPKPARIKVHISEPVYPLNNSWEEIIRLRNEVRAEIAKHCGEPTLDMAAAGFNPDVT